MVCSAGRFAPGGHVWRPHRRALGTLTEREIDVLGVACCGTGEFGEAVALVERNADRLGRLVSHEFSLEKAPEALHFAMENPTEVMKVVIRGDG